MNSDVLNIHHIRAPDIIIADNLTTSPSVPITSYRDGFGNWCSRLVSTPGQMRITAPAIVYDNEHPDPFNLGARRAASNTWHQVSHNAMNFCPLQLMMPRQDRHPKDRNAASDRSWARLSALAAVFHPSCEKPTMAMAIPPNAAPQSPGFSQTGIFIDFSSRCERTYLLPSAEHRKLAPGTSAPSSETPVDEPLSE
jgi:hypothetical protein